MLELGVKTLLQLYMWEFLSGRLIDTFTGNFVGWDRFLVVAGRDVEKSFNGIDLYSKNDREGF